MASHTWNVLGYMEIVCLPRDLLAAFMRNLVEVQDVFGWQFFALLFCKLELLQNSPGIFFHSLILQNRNKAVQIVLELFIVEFKREQWLWTKWFDVIIDAVILVVGVFLHIESAMFVVGNTLHVANNQAVANLLLDSEVVQHNVNIVLPELGHSIAIDNQLPWWVKLYLKSGRLLKKLSRMRERRIR